MGFLSKLNWKKSSKKKKKKQSKRVSAFSSSKTWYEVQSIKLPILIRILANISLAWEIGMYLVTALNFLLVTYGCFFTFYNYKVWMAVFITDILYGADIIMRLGVEIWRHRCHNKVLVFTFPYQFFICVLDLISLFPLYSIVALANDVNSFQHLATVDYYRANAFLRLYCRVYTFFDILHIRRLLSEQVLFLLSFSNLYLVFIIMVSCGFFIFTGLQPVDFILWRNLDFIEDSWAKDFRRKKPGYGSAPFDLYIMSTHFSTATVTTVGYGDFHGETEYEMMYCIVIELIGAIFLNGYFTSQLTNFQLELDGARYDLFFRLDGIILYLKEIGMSEFFQAKVNLYYKCLWTYREGVDRVLFIQHIPRSVQEDVYYDICLEMFHKSYVFQDLDEAFLRTVSKIIKISLYNPDMILCRYGGYANQMFYILQGECQAMSKHDSSKTAATLRAGSIIGETNLFFSCPYTISVVTSTCCQFISIEKEALMSCFNNFSTELTILRERTQNKINQMYDVFEVFGEDPVCWVQRRDPILAKKATSAGLMANTGNTIQARWGDGFNLRVTYDVLSDADRSVIFETKCRNTKYRKNHVTPYQNCVVPEILNTRTPWIIYWNIGILVFVSIYAFIGPYCFSFGAASQFEHYVCLAAVGFQYINEFMCVLDVGVEIIAACPVEGTYFKFHDGLKVKCRQPLFYFDLLAAVPIEFFHNQSPHGIFPSLNVILKSMKLWKLIRYLRFLDNVHPKRMFWFRLAQTFVVLVAGIHFIACIMFFLACPTIDVNDPATDDTFICSETSWMGSWKTIADIEGRAVNKELEPNALASKIPYLVSFYFSAATLTSAGFGDCSPQHIKEIGFTIIFQLIGFFLIGYYTALLTSALTCVVKPQLEFQQKLMAIKRLMQHYVLPEALQMRVVEYYQLQHQYHSGINMPTGAQHYLFDAPDYIKHDVLYTDVVLLLDGVPLFSKVESKYIIKMSQVLKRFLIPPNCTFVHLGEVRRSMYAIREGSIGLFDGKSETPQAILESTGYFGLGDLLFGEPAQYNYVSLSYCVIFEITQNIFNEVFEEDEELLEYVEAKRSETKEEVESMTRTISKVRREEHNDRAMEIPSWIFFKKDSNDAKTKVRYNEYYEFFDQFRFGKFFRMFLLNGVIHPAGLFAHWWPSLISLIVCSILCLIVIETFMYYRPPAFRLVQYFLDLFLFMDVYAKLHWAYYLPDGLLVTHPLKTAASYVFEGSFIYDVLMLAHPELVLAVLNYTSIFGYGRGATWFTKLRWIRFVQIKRIPAIFEIIHTIFQWRNAMLFVLYVAMTLVMCSIGAAIAFAIGCPWKANDWMDGDEYKLPFCESGTWALTKGDVMSTFPDRWIVGVYYVCQVILVVGFGDMQTLRVPEMYLLIFMSVFGFIFMRCIVADLTAAQVDSDEIRTHYIDRMKRLTKIMRREKVSEQIIANVHDHLRHSWKKSKGLQPRNLFADLHPALETDFYESFVGQTLTKVPLFEGLPPNVLRSLCKFVRKLYFSAGERLSRFGNLEHHLYIIKSGKVWITDRFLNYGCTLHKNEAFGESGVLGEIPGRFTVVAAENVEVFAISHEDFAVILNRYPIVKGILNLRTGNGHFDFFEHKIHDMVDWLKTVDKQQKDRRIRSLKARTRLIKHLVYGREEPDKDEIEGDEDVTKFQRKKKNTFISFGTDDEYLPFLYFVSQRARYKKPGAAKPDYVLYPPLIHPNCGFMKILIRLIQFIWFFSPWVTLLEVFFPPIDGPDRFSDVILQFSNAMVYIMFLYMFINLFMPYKDSDGKYVKNSYAIVFNYLLSPMGIWLDLFAAIPPYLSPPATAYQNNLRYIRLSRLVWLHRFYSYNFSIQNDLSASAFHRIKISVSVFCLMAHVLGCVFYNISDCKFVTDETDIDYKCGYRLNQTATWTNTFLETVGFHSDIDHHVEQVRPWRWWVRSLYWVVTVVSTTGFGDITPVNVPEMGMGIITVFCGAFILSIILSHVTASMASWNKSSREYLYQVKLLVKYLQNIGLSSLRQELVQLYFETVWNNMRGNLYHQNAGILPPSLQIEVSHALFGPVLRKVKFFESLDTNFIRQLASKVEHSVYLPGICISKEGDQGDQMFVVYKGSVSCVVHEGEGQNKTTILNSVYFVGEAFGKFPALFVDERYRKSYRASEYTEVLAISQQVILSLTRHYDDFAQILNRYISLKYDADDGDCIFTDEQDEVVEEFDPQEFLRKRKEELEKGSKKNNPERYCEGSIRKSTSMQLLAMEVKDERIIDQLMEMEDGGKEDAWDANPIQELYLYIRSPNAKRPKRTGKKTLRKSVVAALLRATPTAKANQGWGGPPKRKSKNFANMFSKLV